MTYESDKKEASGQNYKLGTPVLTKFLNSSIMQLIVNAQLEPLIIKTRNLEGVLFHICMT